MPFAFRRSALAIVAPAVAACSPDSSGPTSPADRAPSIPTRPSASVQTIVVYDTADLYREVNKVGNAGARIVLMPNTYTLNPTQQHGGRLELQDDMSLQGFVGDARRVIIDASALPATSYNAPDSTTGAVRVGRGANSLEWITVRNAKAGAAAIETDLVSSLPARVTISNVITTGSPRGIDVRNLGAASAGRVLVATISNTESFGNTLGMGQGIRVVNAPDATGAVIRLTLQSNKFHDNRIGGLVANNTTSYGTIAVTSNWDQFDRNGIGLGLIGGVGTASFNVVSFSAQRTTFRDNTQQPPPNTPVAAVAGMTVEGGSSSVAGFTSFNTVSVDLSGVQFGNTPVADLRVWGARSTATLPAGTNNIASVAWSAGGRCRPGRPRGVGGQPPRTSWPS